MKRFIKIFLITFVLYQWVPYWINGEFILVSPKLGDWLIITSITFITYEIVGKRKK